MKVAVLLLAHGAPERVEDVDQYLDRVRASRPGAGPTPPHVVQEVRQRYQEIGGSSPLLKWARRQAEALQRGDLVVDEALLDRGEREVPGRGLDLGGKLLQRRRRGTRSHDTMMDRRADTKT